MRVLPESKIAIVNRLAAAICSKTCVAQHCGLCQLYQLKFGIDSVFGEHRLVEEVIEAMVSNHRRAIVEANEKYDRYVTKGKLNS